MEKNLTLFPVSEKLLYAGSFYNICEAINPSSQKLLLKGNSKEILTKEKLKEKAKELRRNAGKSKNGSRKKRGKCGGNLNFNYEKMVIYGGITLEL